MPSWNYLSIIITSSSTAEFTLCNIIHRYLYITQQLQQGIFIFSTSLFRRGSCCFQQPAYKQYRRLHHPSNSRNQNCIQSIQNLEFSDLQRVHLRASQTQLDQSQTASAPT
ncbi:hypothetical protein Nepgr_006711 [Nepenthes gracilis]|uniref:Uncharacterized protein n=1 Tax=Nepenthes gracilis TaxID=150966 RepID=A0AAD3S5Q9_NEPGR|nr:hypothetical protein Nepgr_006711 [Nepenthes gracilis]